MSVTILTGDCRQVLKTLPDASVHCVVTSPPYFGLRDYGTAKWEGGHPECDHMETKGTTRGGPHSTLLGGQDITAHKSAFRDTCGICGATRIDSQIGLEPTPAEFVAEMVAVFREVRRVLRDDGTLFLNLGDSYWTGGQRHTGRNDTSRETPGGRGGSFRGGARRAIACDMDDKEPEGSPAHDCFCQSLCDACRAAYRIGRFHSGRRHVPTPVSSSSVSNHEHMGLPSAHVPTSDLGGQGDHSEGAKLDPQQVAALAGELHHGAPESTSRQSCGTLPDRLRSLTSIRADECRSCGRSLPDCAPASCDSSACTCDTVQPSGASFQNTLGMFSSGSAYQSLTTTSLKPKDLIGVPWRVAFALQADGWYLRQDIIWSKPNPMPESVRDRCTKAHEYLFLLSKSARYFYDADAIAEAADTAGKIGGFTGYQAIAMNVTPSGNQIAENGKSYVRPETRNRRSVWEVATQPFSEAHFATFPPALIEPCIKAGCPIGGTVLDPFGGAGTTGLVADRLGRNAILIELNPAYAEMARKRLLDDAGMFAEVA